MSLEMLQIAALTIKLNTQTDCKLQHLPPAPPPELRKKTIIIRQEIEDGEVVSESAHEHNTQFNNQDARVEEDEETPVEQKEDEASSDAVEQNE